MTLRSLAFAPLVTVVLTSLTALAAPPPDRNAWHFDEWSNVVVIGAGSYRGAEKGIEVKDGSKATIGPNVMIENFRMRGPAAQRLSWNLERSLLRNCEFGGDWATNLQAKNCAFDNSSVGKTGGLSVDYWSTIWRFENCVFAKRFTGDFSVRNASVRAVKCTFYGVTLPGISYPPDASETAQCNELRFEQCKFVKCVVPETFLASTIRCVFEDCTFPGPAGADWSKSKKPITVNAFIAGRGSAPVSYANTQLRVIFKTGSATAGGASIQASYADEKLSYAAIPAAKETLVLGDTVTPIQIKPVPAGVAQVASIGEGAAMPATPPPQDPTIRSALAKIEATSPMVVRASQLARALDAVALPAKPLGDELFKLKALRPQLPPASLSYFDALLAHTNLIRTWQSAPPQTSNGLSEWAVRLDVSMKYVREQREKLSAVRLAGAPIVP